MSEYKKRCDEVLIPRRKGPHNALRVDRKMTDEQLLELLMSVSEKHKDNDDGSSGRELI